HLLVLGWNLKARVAMAESDRESAREYVQEALTIAQKFEVPVVAWQAYATAWQFFLHTNEDEFAEANRDCAEASILKIANSFEASEPLRATFLGAAPVRRVLSKRLSWAAYQNA